MGIPRVHYRERQQLTAADLRAEQDYRLGLARRHHLAPHQWGVVRGLSVVNVNNRYVLMPGVAIDGYGRELLVTEPFDLDIDGTPECLFVMLYYCEFPADAQLGRTCHDTPAPRTAQRARVFTGGLVTPPLDSDDLIFTLPSAPPWPVVVDAIGEQAACRVARHDALHYVRHRASLVRSPSARARMTLGLERRTDVYQFLVTTAGATNALEPRLGIDRDGITQVWKRLVIWGPMATGAVAALAGPIVKIDVPYAARPLQRLQMTGTLDLAKHQLSVGLRPFAGASIPLLATAPVTQRVRFSKQLQLLKGGVHDATLKVIGDLGAPSVHPAEPTPFSIVMNATGGLLAMSPPEMPKTEKLFRCEQIERERATPVDEATAAVVCGPAAAFVDDPAAREVYAITTSAADAPVAETTFRLSGGAEDKTDVSTRFSIGRSPTNLTREWVASVRMDGGRRLEVLAAKPADPALDVEGTIYLPAIGKDDPLMPDMMAMAFMAGLRQAGKILTSTFTISLRTPTTPSIHRGETLSYTFSGLPTGVTVRRAVELVSGVAGTHDLTFRSIPLPLTSPITIDTFTHTASKVQLQLVLLTATGNASPKLVIAPPLSIDVTN